MRLTVSCPADWARVLIIATFLLIAACSEAPPTAVDGIVIEHATLISPERDGLLRNTDVVIRDGRIVAVGANLGATAGARRIDAHGRYLIPGLIDTHVHVGNPMALDEGAIKKHPELLSAYRAQVPRAYLAFGFTTVVDVDSRPDDRAWFEGSALHPRLYHCGRAVRIVGGYGALRIPADAAPRDFPHLLDEPGRSAKWPSTLDPKAHTPAQVVQRVVDAGGRCVKTFVESGFGVFDWPVPHADTLAALRAKTKRHGLTFIVHATSADAWRAAIDAQADVIAHGLWHWPGRRQDAMPTAEVRSVIEGAARAGVRVQPTLQVLQNDHRFSTGPSSTIRACAGRCRPRSFPICEPTKRRRCGDRSPTGPMQPHETPARVRARQRSSPRRILGYAPRRN